MKILVIDDDPLARKVIVSAIEKMGHVAIQSANGKHAWETLWENPEIALIITDMMMPDMDGRELIQIIRGNQAFVELPVIILSGVVGADDVADVLKLGSCVFCRKPAKIDELKKQIHEFIGG